MDRDNRISGSSGNSVVGTQEARAAKGVASKAVKKLE